MMSVVEARELAVSAHGDQRDRDGSPHIDHVARVAERVPKSDAHQRVAWLHDVVEDSEVSIDELGHGLPDSEIDAIRLLTYDETEPRQVYINRIVLADGRAGSLARSVKEADMLDNLRRCAIARDPAIGQYGCALATLWSSDGASSPASERVLP